MSRVGSEALELQSYCKGCTVSFENLCLVQVLRHWSSRVTERVARLVLTICVLAIFTTEGMSFSARSANELGAALL